ncbi:MAG: VOC family protein [Woeseiaceae bacterium]|nr:VOC family protein [Woeseiaceae bacterium]
MPTLGPIMQNGFVVRDWREAAMHWADKLGVGPFFVLEHVEFDVCRYRGEQTDIDMTVAIAYTGGYQIELVQQHNDAPSIYTEFLENNEPGLQHVGIVVDDLDAALDGNRLRDRIVQEGRTAAGQRFAYVDTILHNGTMIELIEADDAMRKSFAYMEKAAADWDGSDPVRG